MLAFQRTKLVWGPLALALTTTLLPGCGTKTETKEHVDAGAVCLRTNANQLLLEVTSPGCLSSSCDAVTDQSCSISVEDDTITVSSLFVIESEVGGSCTTDCGISSCKAASDALTDGDYTVIYGDRQETFSAAGEAMAVTLFGDDSPLGAYRCGESND